MTYEIIVWFSTVLVCAASGLEHQKPESLYADTVSGYYSIAGAISSVSTMPFKNMFT